MGALELKVPPPVIALLAAVSMWLLAAAAPSLSFSFRGSLACAIVLSAAGLVVAVSGIVSFRRARTTTNPMRPAAASSLVVGGIYRFTRNPMYLGLLLALSGLALFLANLAAFAVLPAFVLYMNRFQIQPEERALSARFPSDYPKYKSRVRRWL